MDKIVKHSGIEYSVDKLILIKGQGIVIKTDNTKCLSDAYTIMSADTKKPIVIKNGDDTFLVIIDSTHPRSERSFEATLISKHILKKAKVEPPVVLPRLTRGFEDLQQRLNERSGYTPRPFSNAPSNNYQR